MPFRTSNDAVFQSRTLLDAIPHLERRHSSFKTLPSSTSNPPPTPPFTQAIYATPISALNGDHSYHRFLTKLFKQGNFPLYRMWPSLVAYFLAEIFIPSYR